MNTNGSLGGIYYAVHGTETTMLQHTKNKLTYCGATFRSIMATHYVLQLPSAEGDSRKFIN